MKTVVFKIANLLLFVLSSSLVFAQPVITSNTSSPSSCDGSAQFVDSSSVVSSSIYWSDSSNVIQQGGYYLYGLCPGVYTVTYTDSSASNQTYTFNIGSGSSNPCSGFYATASIAPSTDSTNCNGSVTIYPYGGSSPYIYTWGNAVAGNVSSATNVCAGLGYCVVSDANGCNYTVQYNISDSSGNGGNPCAGFNVSVQSSSFSDSINWYEIVTITTSGGIAPFNYNWSDPTIGNVSIDTIHSQGYYTCLVTDSYGCADTVLIYIEDPSNNPCAGFFATTISYPASDSASCDGLIEVTVSGGSVPYTYSLSSGSTYPSGSIGNLCIGTYEIAVVDANGCDYYVYGTVMDSSSFIPDSSNIISNPTYGDSIITDTLDYSWIYDCIFDLGSIDSAYVLDNSYWGIDSVMVTWILIDSNGVVLGTYSVFYPTGGSSGVVSVFLTVICPIHSPGDNALMASDQIYLPGASANINESNLTKVNVVNPFEDELKLNFTETAERNILLYDLKGANVLRLTSFGNKLSIDTRLLNKGMYVLSIQEGTNFYQTKVVK
ncbi:MAG: T9SS type A sorting domain-containing protein [Flavobacteriia bacterium]|jgi:hypothetical protein